MIFVFVLFSPQQSSVKTIILLLLHWIENPPFANICLLFFYTTSNTNNCVCFLLVWFPSKRMMKVNKKMCVSLIIIVKIMVLFIIPLNYPSSTKGNLCAGYFCYHVFFVFVVLKLLVLLRAFWQLLKFQQAWQQQHHQWRLLQSFLPNRAHHHHQHWLPQQHRRRQLPQQHHSC